MLLTILCTLLFIPRPPCRRATSARAADMRSERAVGGDLITHGYVRYIGSNHIYGGVQRVPSLDPGESRCATSCCANGACPSSPFATL